MAQDTKPTDDEKIVLSPSTREALELHLLHCYEWGVEHGYIVEDENGIRFTDTPVSVETNEGVQ